MRRRSLMLGTAAVLLAAGCSRSGDSRPSSKSSATLPPGPAPIVSWSLTGGYLSAGRMALRPPRLVVYPDGSVIADATYRSDLTTAAVAGLAGQIAEDLRGSNVTRRKDGVDAVADTPTTVLAVRTARGTQTASAEGVEELRQQDGYPAALYDALDRITAVHQRVVAAGSPYTAARVRLVTEPGGAVGAAAPQPWPRGIAMPQRQGPGGVQLDDLDGDRARTAVKLITRDVDLNGAWTAYQTAAGETVRASWRYLLPDE